MSIEKVQPRLGVTDKYSYTKNEKTVLFYQSNPVEACRDILMREPTWFQRQALRELWDKPYCLLKWSRGSSKSSLTAMYLMLKSILFPGCNMGIIAPSYRQTSYVFDELEDLYHNSPFVRQSCIDVPKRSNDRCVVKFYNGSRIEGLPIGTDGKTIRGRRYSFLFLDEFAQMDEETVRLVIRPMLSVMRKGRRNQLIVASTPFYKFNHFWERYTYYKRMMVENPDDYYCSSRNLVDVVISKHKEFQMDLKMVLEAYNSDPEDSFMMEWMGIFPNETAGFFTSQLIDSCVPRGIRELIPMELCGEIGYKYVMGVDPARSEQGDQFSISLMKINKGNKQVTKVFSRRGMAFPDMADQIRREIFVNKFDVVQLKMDSRGGGRELQDLLAKPWFYNGVIYPAIVTPDDMFSGNFDKEHCLPILDMVDFNVRSINEMYFKFKADMEQQRVLFPMDIRRHQDPGIEEIGKEIVALKNEMRVLQTTVTANGLKFSAPNKFTKDRITATIMANSAASEYEKDEFTDVNLVNNLLEMGQWISTGR